MPKVMVGGSARAQLAYPRKRRRFGRARSATLTLVGLGLGLSSGWGCSRGEVGDLPPSVTVASGTLQRIVVATGTLERANVLTQRGTMPDQQYDDTRSRHERAVVAVTRSKAMVSRLEVELRYATVRAPMDGIVLEIPIEEGSAVSSVLSVTGGTPILTLASTTALHLEGLVDENEIARVMVGQPVKIRTEAFGSATTFVGEVRHISPIGKRVQNVTYFEVEVDVFDAGAEKLLPRMAADADIVTETAANVLWVPETALHYEGDEIYLELVAPDAEERLVVKLGIIEGDRVELVSGASEGDLVRLR